MAREQKYPVILDDREDSAESRASRQNRDENILVCLRYAMAIGLVVVLGYLISGLL